ncbi:MAG: ribosome-associated translation inhibitor RaiA [Acidimicrobiia bacterium]|nr:ribosome-associated translation inhibitor RaiA [Acidimicrobiia bacterium]
MRLELTARHLDLPPGMRRAVQAHLARLQRVLNDSALSAQVVLTRERTRLTVEMTLHARGEHFLHARATGRDWQTALDTAAGKVSRQAARLKSRWKERKRRGVPASRVTAAPPGEKTPRRPPGTRSGDDVRVVRARTYSVRPMSVEEAVLELQDGTNAFLVFRNAATDAVSVLYRRPDRHLGLIEPEA